MLKMVPVKDNTPNGMVLKVIPWLKIPPQICDETWYVDVARQGDIKNVIKRGGHLACFHATMLTNTIKVTFGDLRA